MRWCYCSLCLFEETISNTVPIKNTIVTEFLAFPFPFGSDVETLETDYQFKYRKSGWHTTLDNHTPWWVHLRHSQRSTANFLMPPCTPFTITWASMSWPLCDQAALYLCVLYLLPDLRHKVPTEPPHYVTLYTNIVFTALCCEIKGLEGGVTGWIKVIAEETGLKDYSQATWDSGPQVWPSDNTDGYDSALYIAVGRQAYRKVEVYRWWREETKERLNNVLFCPHFTQRSFWDLVTRQ